MKSILLMLLFLVSSLSLSAAESSTTLLSGVNPKHIFYAIIAFLVFDFLLEKILDALNYSHLKPELPNELSSIYDEEKYKKSQDYEKCRSKFGFIKSLYSFALLIAVIFLGGFAYVDTLAASFVDGPILTALLFFGIFMIASDIVSLPFQIYSVFVIEERFGFNKMTPALFIMDKLKGYLLSALIGGGLLAAIIWTYMLTQSMFWIYAWAIVSLFSIFMTMFYSSVIVPLFNKQTRLEDGELRHEIESFSTKTGFKLDNIFEIDGSKRSTKANAYFSGFGVKKRIVLFDTLIKEMSVQEIVAVLAHEIGHYKKRHVLVSMVIGIVQTGIIFYIFSILVSSIELSQALGVQEQSFHIALIAFTILFTPINLFIGLGMNIFSRKNEYQADNFAAQTYSADALASALKKLSVKNLSNLTPHPLYVFFHYSHPPVLKRLQALKK